MNSLKAMYGCGLNFFIKLAYNSLFLYKFAITFHPKSNLTSLNVLAKKFLNHGRY